MIQIELNKKNENPFFGLSNCLDVFNSNISVSTIKLDEAWKEVKDSKEKREMFFSLLFSIGDITNRQHNIFNGKKDSGGNADRESFETIINWIWKNHPYQFTKFLNAHLFTD